jgi:kinetochore protein Spc24
MLLDEEPAAVRPFSPKTPRPQTLHLQPPQLIAQCTKNFKFDGDRDSLLRISDSLATLSQFRTQQLSSLQSTLQKLSRTHQTLASQHSHTLSQHNPTIHAQEILRLDTEKFKIAKQANDLEVEGERLQSELQRLGGVLAELDEEGVEGAERERGVDEDATVCVYHSSLHSEPGSPTWCFRMR